MRIKKNIFIFCVLIALVVPVHIKAQQLGIFTNYVLNDYYYNPAVVGSKEVAVANLTYRDQWAGFDQAPVTYMGSVYGSIKNKRKVGLGGNIISEKAGLTQRTGGYFTYAYHFDLTKKLRIGLGLSAGFLQYRIKLYDVKVIDNGDDMLTGNVLSSNAFDANSGFYLYHEKFFFGISGSQLLNYKLPFTNSNSRLKPHVYATGGYNLLFGGGKVKKNEIQPSFMIRSTNNNINAQADISLKYTYNKAFFIAATYRTESAICALIGFNYKNKFNIAYAYDYAMNRINQYSVGSHEIWLSYTITKKVRTLSEEEAELDNSVQQLYKDQQNQKKKEEDEKK